MAIGRAAKSSGGGRDKGKLTGAPGSAAASRGRGVGEDGVLRLEGTRLLAETLACPTRILVHQGGSRSSKTYSIAQAVILVVIDKAMRGDHFVITIARKHMPALRATAMKDFFEILQKMGLYDERLHNKTDNIYRLANVEVEFLSLDDPQKVRGRKRDLLWMNEANEFDYEDFKQFALRTTGRMILDYNPSDEYHWIYDKVLVRDDVTFVRSTYKDNPFLSLAQIREIERLQETDPVAWKVYGLGERGASEATIFPDFEIVEGIPEEGERAFGLDFGYTQPSALVEVRILDDSLYMRELLYEPKLTLAALMRRLEDLLPERWVPVYCDSTNPDRIEEMYGNGFNARPADKRPYSVEAGIDFMKRHKIYVDRESKNLISELRHYKWVTDRTGQMGRMPVKERDHAIDAARYAAYTHWGRAPQWLMAEDIEDATVLEFA